MLEKVIAADGVAAVMDEIGRNAKVAARELATASTETRTKL